MINKDWEEFEIYKIEVTIYKLMSHYATIDKKTQKYFSNKPIYNKVFRVLKLGKINFLFNYLYFLLNKIIAHLSITKTNHKKFKL